MGKAIIVSGGGEGLYTITVQLERHRITERQAKLTERLSDLDSTEIPAAQAELTAKQAALDSTVSALNAAIAAYQPGTPIEPLRAPIEATAKAVTARDAAQSALDRKKMERESLRREQARLGNAPQDETRQAWCADYSQNITGTVGTCEVPGERKGGQVLIRPANDAPTGAAWTSTDGQIQPSQASTPAGTFVNLSLLPGWQKWDPTYRVGTLTGFNAQNGNLCIVQLDDAISSQRPEGKTLHVCETLELVDVPIQYMGCHELVFDVGDRVLVKFTGQDRTQPKVIGFESHPKSCISKGFLIPQGKIEKPAAAWTFTAHTGYLYGNIDWRGPSSGGAPGKTLSWAGPHARHFPSGNDPAWDSKVYEGGLLKGTAPGNVYGACVRDVSGILHLTVICHASGTDTVYTRPYDSTDDALYDAQTHPTGWRAICVWQAGEDYLTADRPWFFSGSGTEARCMRVALPQAASGTYQRLQYYRESEYEEATLQFRDDSPPQQPQLHELVCSLSGLSASFSIAGNSYEAVAYQSGCRDTPIVTYRCNDGWGHEMTCAIRRANAEPWYTLSGRVTIAVDYVGDNAVRAYQDVDDIETSSCSFSIVPCDGGSWDDEDGHHEYLAQDAVGSIQSINSTRSSWLRFSASSDEIPLLDCALDLRYEIAVTGFEQPCIASHSFTHAQDGPTYIELAKLMYLDVRTETVLVETVRRDYAIQDTGSPPIPSLAYAKTLQARLYHRGSLVATPRNIIDQNCSADATWTQCDGFYTLNAYDFFFVLGIINVDGFYPQAHRVTARWLGEWTGTSPTGSIGDLLLPEPGWHGELHPSQTAGFNVLPYVWLGDCNNVPGGWTCPHSNQVPFCYDGFWRADLTGYQPVNVRCAAFTGSVCVDANGSLFADFQYQDENGDTQRYSFLSGADPATLIGDGPYYPIGVA